MIGNDLKLPLGLFSSNRSIADKLAIRECGEMSAYNKSAIVDYSGSEKRCW